MVLKRSERLALKRELKSKKVLLKKLRTELKERPDDSWKDEAQSLIDKLFETWKQGGQFIKDTHRDGRENLTIFSPIGMPRHLYAYLHESGKFKGAMDRRGPNSIIQGFSSQAGTRAGFLISQEVWETFTSKGIDINFQGINTVHDSLVMECLWEATPIGLYLIEHGMTTLTMDHIKSTYGFELPLPFNVDIGVGFSEKDIVEWKDQRYDSMEKIIKETARESKHVTRKQLKDCLFNLNAIAKVRLKELRNDPWKMTLKGKTDWYVRNLRGLPTTA